MGSISAVALSLLPLQTHLAAMPTTDFTLFRSFAPRPPTRLRRTKAGGGGMRGNRSRREEEAEESMTVFVNENGVVDDMDAYLNFLSLEYDSVWDTKPSWCQPWTITLTGVSVVACSWAILHSVLVTALVAVLIGAWWYIFLYSYPKSYSDMIAERRKRVTDGLEDTYGQKKNV